MPVAHLQELQQHPLPVINWYCRASNAIAWTGVVPDRNQDSSDGFHPTGSCAPLSNSIAARSSPAIARSNAARRL